MRGRPGHADLCGAADQASIAPSAEGSRGPGIVALFGPNPEKVQRWKAEGKVSRLRSAVEEGGETGELAQKALEEIVSDPSRFPGVDDSAVTDAFRVLLDLDQRAATEALIAYAGQPSIRAPLAAAMIDLLAARGSDAALLALLRLSGSRAGSVAAAAVRALARMDHPHLDGTLCAAIPLVGREALEHLLDLLAERLVPGAGEALLGRLAGAPPDLRKPIARALHRQGLTAAMCRDPEARAYLLVEEGRYADAAALGAPAWQPLAEALGGRPARDTRTLEILSAMGRVDRARLGAALRLKLLRAVTAAIEKPTRESYDLARETAAWVLPAWAEVIGRREQATDVSGLIRDERFLAVRGMLEIE